MEVRGLVVAANVFEVNLLHGLVRLKVLDSNGLIDLVSLDRLLFQPVLFSLHFLELLQALGHSEPLLLHFEIAIAFLDQFRLVHLHHLPIDLAANQARLVSKILLAELIVVRIIWIWERLDSLVEDGHAVLDSADLGLLRPQDVEFAGVRVELVQRVLPPVLWLELPRWAQALAK